MNIGGGRGLLDPNPTEFTECSRRGAPQQSGAAALSAAVDAALATSTQAVRLAAGTRSDFGDALLAGLGVPLGSMHGAAGSEVVRFLTLCEERGVDGAISDELQQTGQLPGFGGGAYPGVDPRFVALMPFVTDLADDTQRDTIEKVLRARSDQSLSSPTVDLALGMLVWSSGATADYATAIFAIARLAGWTAHYLEALNEPARRIRSRAASAAPLWAHSGIPAAEIDVAKLHI